MLWLKLFSVLVILLNFKSHNADVFTSIEQMTSLVSVQSEITKRLWSLVNEQYENIEKTKKMIDDFQLISNLSQSDPINFVGNPINSFLLIKKMTKDLTDFVESITSTKNFDAWMNDMKKKFIMPTNEDYEGSIKAIHRLVDTYLLNPTDIRQGNISKTHPSRQLTALECTELGKIAYDIDNYYDCIRWMKEASEQYKIEMNNSTDLYVDILDYWSYSSMKLDDFETAVKLVEEIIKIDPNVERFHNNLEYFKELRDESTKNSTIKINNDDEDEKINDIYEALCRDDPKLSKIFPQKDKHKLKCRYVNHHPLLLIAPVKQEQLFADPDIWIFYDVISEEEIEIMKNLGSKKLKRAVVVNPSTGIQEPADYRISKSGWIEDEDHPKLNYLTALVSAVTNLSLKTAEQWQIANYGIGGQYDPHFDFHRKSDSGEGFDPEVGNRIATWLFYLEAPEAGGATVFTRIGARVKPVRRSAAFWYNLHTSLDGDFRTRHAACPVLFGNKWVSNKWIHTVDQEFRRPCNLQREDSPEAYD